MKDLTILIKTFKRPRMYNRLLGSIKRYYHGTEIITLDDSDENSVYGFDIGLSRGRNELVKMCKTKYCMILDDDCIFTGKTKLEELVKDLKRRDLDIIQPKVSGLRYAGRFRTEGDTVYYEPDHKHGLYHYCLNIFVAKTDSLRKHPWDESLKMGEHFAFFYEHMDKLKIGLNNYVSIDHEHESSPEYDKYRYRAENYLKQYMNRKGIKLRVEDESNKVHLYG